jgi:hypothetical protein
VMTATGSYLGVFPVVTLLAAAGCAVAWVFLRRP